MKVRFTKTALRQIEKALNYIGEHSPRGTDGVGRRIHSIVTGLTQQPFAGQATARPGQRRMVVTPYPYVIFYRIIGNEIIIQRLRHMARRPLTKGR